MEDTPSKVKSKIGGRSHSPAGSVEDVEIKEESRSQNQVIKQDQPKKEEEELTAEERADRRREQLKRELAEMKRNPVKKVKRF